MVLVNKDDFYMDIVEWDMEISQQDRWIGMDFGVMITREDIIVGVQRCIAVEDMELLGVRMMRCFYCDA